MSGYVGILVSDSWLQNQFTQVELRSLKTQMSRLKVLGENLTEEERRAFIQDMYWNMQDEVDFELFLRISVHLKLQAQASARTGCGTNNSSAFLKAATTTLPHTISESEKASYVAHVNNYRKDDSFLKKYLPIDSSTNGLFEIAKDGVLLWRSIYVDNVFEDLRNGWVLLETLDQISPGIVNWKVANKPPIKMPFKKVENCNQVIKLAKQLKFSLVNVAGNDIVQGNKKLILAYLWQLMRCNMLQLLKNLRFHSSGKEINDADIIEWANTIVRESGRKSCMISFNDKRLSDGIFFLELLSAVKPKAVNWSLVSRGVTDEEKKMNARYIRSIARKLGCSIFLLPEDITEVNQKMILTLTAIIMYWFLKKTEEERSAVNSDSDAGSQVDTSSNAAADDSGSEYSTDSGSL